MSKQLRTAGVNSSSRASMVRRRRSTAGLTVAVLLSAPAAGLAQTASNLDAAIELSTRLQPAPCPVTATLRLPAAGSTDRFVSLRGCTQQTIIGQPQLVPSRMEPVIIPGTVEKAPEADEPQADDKDANVRRHDGEPVRSRMLAGMLLPAALMMDDPLLAPLAPRPSYARMMPVVRIAPAGPEITAEAIAAMSRLSPASDGAADGPAATAIMALAPRSYATRFNQLIAAAARRHAIDPLLLHAVIKQESHYGAYAVSRAGAVGLMQIMPATGARFGRAHGALFDPACNVDVGARLLRTLHARYRGNLELMLAAYNAGEGAVSRYGNRVPPFRETRDYVRRVKTHYVTLALENGFSGLAL